MNYLRRNMPLSLPSSGCASATKVGWSIDHFKIRSRTILSRFNHPVIHQCTNWSLFSFIQPFYIHSFYMHSFTQHSFILHSLNIYSFCIHSTFILRSLKSNRELSWAIVRNREQSSSTNLSRVRSELVKFLQDKENRLRSWWIAHFDGIQEKLERLGERSFAKDESKDHYCKMNA